MSAIKFEDFNFEIIDIDLPGRPYMLIGKNTLSFSKVVAERMNYPAQILAYFDHSTQTFAIKGCKVGAHSSIRFSKSKTEQKGRISLNSSAISGSMIRPDVLTGIVTACLTVPAISAKKQ